MVWRRASARDRLIAEPVPRRRVSANFDNASGFGLLAQLEFSDTTGTRDFEALGDDALAVETRTLSC